MSAEFELDEGLRRVIVTVRPGGGTPVVADTVLNLVRRRAALGSWDWIIDLRQPYQQAPPEKIEEIAEAFNAARSNLSYTVFISTDEAIHERCRMLDQAFFDRRHLVAPSMPAAKAMLPRGMRPV